MFKLFGRGKGMGQLYLKGNGRKLFPKLRKNLKKKLKSTDLKGPGKAEQGKKKNYI